MKSTSICVSHVTLAVVLAGSLSLAFGLCGTATSKIEPTGTNIGSVQFDAVIELNRYSPRSLRHDYTVMFARYWVARDYYSAAVVWAEPQSTDLFFALHPPSLAVASTERGFNVCHDSVKKYDETYKKPLGERGVFRYKFGSYPIDNLRFADQEALATRIHADDLKDLLDADQSDGEVLDVSMPAGEAGGTRDVAKLKVQASGKRIDSMELFDAKQQLLKGINYEYASNGGKSYLCRQTAVLPERPMMVGFTGEGMKVTLDGKEYRYRDLEAMHHAGGRTCSVEYELVTFHDEAVERRKEFLEEKAALDVTEEQWKLIKPKLERLRQLCERANSKVGAGLAGGSSETGTGPTAGPRALVPTWQWKIPWKDKPPAELTEAQKLAEQLITLVERQNVAPGTLKRTMDALRKARRGEAEIESQLAGARRDLRELLTMRQEAALVLMNSL